MMHTEIRFHKTSLAALLKETIVNEAPLLRVLNEEEVRAKPNGPQSWSPKEELGHLIDSAANNHQRFVRAALEPEYAGPGYAQDAWVAINGYQNIAWERLVSLWHSYNLLLVEVVKNIPEAKLATQCTIGAYAPATLGFVIEDYVKHMQHHLDHILGREFVRPYPSQRAATENK
jgi:hypothetical protein